MYLNNRKHLKLYQMKTYPTNEIKNVVLLGASGAGKTTLADAMAFDGKVIDLSLIHI